MTTLTEFLLNRLTEDEAVAKAATSAPWVTGIKRRGEPGRWFGAESQSVLADRTRFGIEEHEPVVDGQSRADVAHIARHDPARVLAECESKRRIVELHRTSTGIQWTYQGACLTCGTHEEYPVPWPCPTLQLLALPYSDHETYDEELEARMSTPTPYENIQKALAFARSQEGKPYVWRDEPLAEGDLRMRRSWEAERVRLAALTPEQREAENRQRVEKIKQAEEDVLAAHLTLVGETSGLRRAVLELHAPEGTDRCAGCDPGDYATSSAEWPCRTYELARDWEGIL